MEEDEHRKEMEAAKRRMSINRRETVYQKERRRSDGTQNANLNTADLQLHLIINHFNSWAIELLAS